MRHQVSNKMRDLIYMDNFHCEEIVVMLEESKLSECSLDAQQQEKASEMFL